MTYDEYIELVNSGQITFSSYEVIKTTNYKEIYEQFLKNPNTVHPGYNMTIKDMLTKLKMLDVNEIVKNLRALAYCSAEEVQKSWYDVADLIEENKSVDIIGENITLLVDVFHVAKH